MFKKITQGIICSLLLGTTGMMGCGSGGGGPNIPVDVNPGTALEALSKGVEAFQARDLEAAKDAFCKELVDEPNDSKLAFGCFWAKWMLLPTTQEASTLLAAFEEEPLSLDVQYYGPTGIFTLISEVDRLPEQVFPQFNYGHFALPFHDANSGPATIQSNLLNRAVENGVSAHQIQGMFDDLIPPLEELENLGKVFVADSAFSFVLPKELFNVSADVNVTPNDASLFVSGVETAIVSYQFINAYDLGVEIEKVAFGGAPNGFIKDDNLLEDLNGSGATVDGITFDTVSFLTLLDGARITSSKDRFLKACILAKSGLQKLEAGETSQFFTPATGEGSLADAISLLEDLIASVNDGPTPIRAISSHSITLNLGRLFSTPPDAAALPVSAGDPFVLENNDVKAVESYFKTLFSGIAEF